MNLQHWIKSDAVSYDREKGIFSLDDRNVSKSLVQSPRPLSKGELITFSLSNCCQKFRLMQFCQTFLGLAILSFVHVYLCIMVPKFINKIADFVFHIFSKNYFKFCLGEHIKLR